MRRRLRSLSNAAVYIHFDLLDVFEAGRPLEREKEAPAGDHLAVTDFHDQGVQQ